MDVNIDKRIFKFVMNKKFKGFDNDYLWFEKDFIFVKNAASLLVIPCKNEYNNFGLEYLKLKEVFGRSHFDDKSFRIHLSNEISEDYYTTKAGCCYIRHKYVMCSMGFTQFMCRKLSKDSISSRVLEYIKKDFKYKISISSGFFEQRFLKNSAIFIDRGNDVLVNLDSTCKDASKILFLCPLKNRFNGLDKKKGFTLYYDDLGKGGLYKAVQGDLTLFEMGVYM